MKNEIAVIIGAGPAGLTAANELLNTTDIKPIVLEMSGEIGGISRTVSYKDNRIDIGGHRFFSKSKRIMEYWQDILPLQGSPSKDDIILNRPILLSDRENAPSPEETDKVMLSRKRISRVMFLRKYFDYPISLNIQTIMNLGATRISKILMSYLYSCIRQNNEETLEDFIINRFGKELYLTFFKDYTEKVWGVPCSKISAEWGMQRIKDLSVSKAFLNILKKAFATKCSLEQTNVETSLIDQFMYPKLGPGQLWEELAQIVKNKGAQICLYHKVVGVKQENNKISEVVVQDTLTKNNIAISANYVFSSMPIKDFIISLGESTPIEIQAIAKELQYRDFITLGILLKEMEIKNKTKIKTINNIVPDNWIYIQEKDVKLGRLQVFNNWSPYMVKDIDTVWIGLEYFCNQSGALWNMPDNKLTEFAVNELVKLGIASKSKFLDSTIIRVPKAYPAYFGAYSKFDMVKEYLNSIENFFPIGRNGMHKYNNQDHSMLTAIYAVENVSKEVKEKENIWAVNTEKEYHEVAGK